MEIQKGREKGRGREKDIVSKKKEDL